MAVRFPPSFKIKQSNNLLFIFQSHPRFISVIVGYTSLQLEQKIRASFLIFILFIPDQDSPIDPRIFPLHSLFPTARRQLQWQIINSLSRCCICTRLYPRQRVVLDLLVRGRGHLVRPWTGIPAILTPTCSSLQLLTTGVFLLFIYFISYLGSLKGTIQTEIQNRER